MRRTLSAALIMGALATPAQAQEVVALDPVAGRSTPVLDRGSVVWTQPLDAGVRVLARPAAGGATTEVGRAPDAVSWALAAGGTRLGLRTETALLGGPFGSGLSRLRTGVPAGRAMSKDRDFWAWAGGYVSLEREAAGLRAVVTTDDGRTRELPLPAGADPATLAVADTVAAVVTADAIVVFDLADATVVRRVPLGDLRGLLVISLAVGADGELALTGETGGGADVLAWSPPGHPGLEVVLTDDRFGLVQVAAGRIAVALPGGRRNAVRPVVLQPRLGGEPTLLFRGPPAYDGEALDFDGTHVAWSSQACQFVAPAVPGASRLTIPPGPCPRTEVALMLFSNDRVRVAPASVPIRIRCLTAPTSRCRIDVRAYAMNGRALGRTRTTIRRGTLRTLRVAIPRAAAERLRRSPRDVVLFRVRLTDPDGRVRELLL